MNSNIKLPDDVLEIFSVIKEYGADAYVVGGCVRDSLMGRTPHDWDICTPALVCELLSIFEEKGYYVIPTGLKHGTITVHLNGNNYEITTFRKDGSSSNHRHPDNVEFTSDLELDLERRDFTINAMAYNSEIGLIDLFGGLDDIENKVIRCVEDPKDRFNEDALRLMRAIRFACQLGFSIHPSIGWEISYTDICEDLKYVSAERINSEFCKMSICDDFYKRLVWNMRLFKTIFPELEDLIDNHRNDFLSTVDALKNCKSKDLITRLSIFFKIFDVDKVEPIMRRLRFDCNTIKKVKELVDFKCPYKFGHPCILQNEVSIKRYLMLLGIEQFKRLVTLYESYGIESDYDGIKKNLNKVISSRECYLMKDLAINGDDLIANGFTPGKDIGEILNELLLIVMSNNNLNTKEELLILAQELKQELKLRKERSKMNSNLKVGNTTGENNIEDIIVKIENSRSISMSSVVPPADMRDCDHCNKNSVCKYKERMEEAIDYLNNLYHDDERFAEIPLVIDIKCKEFSIGYTGVR